uniref:Uncharacterized protein n=1 Tax=viral metagenome TaxID=1070528 RepID=A0A6H2A1B1_9ZZZZ
MNSQLFYIKYAMRVIADLYEAYNEIYNSVSPKDDFLNYKVYTDEIKRCVEELEMIEKASTREYRLERGLEK